MKSITCVRLSLGLIGVALLFCSTAGAQTTPPMTRNDRRMSPDSKPAEKSSEILKDRKRLDETIKHSLLEAKPCDILTRDELETILKRSDNDRALVTMPTKGDWEVQGRKVHCSYFVNYENRIFPDLANDNAVSIDIDFGDQNAKRGKLIVDPYAEGGYGDRQLVTELVTGLGDEALYVRDKSRFKYEEKFKNTAGALPYQYYDNQESLYVRKNDLFLKFKIIKIVAGGGNSETVMQIARKALVRVP